MFAERADVTSQVERRPALDYRPCRYGASRIAFRGPGRPLDGPFVALVGGSETYGKFVERPFAHLLEERIGEPVVNLGVMNAGLTLIREDPAILPIASAARLTVIQVLGAQNMSNRFYSVHPRRNDRFLGASARMKRLFPTLDFTEFHYTGHLLAALDGTGQPEFGQLLGELQDAWVARMRSILEDIGGDCVLLWMSERRPEDVAARAWSADPHFVTRDMLEALSPNIAGIVEVVAPASERTGGLSGKHYLPGEARAAAAMPGPGYHDRVARALAGAIAATCPEKEGRPGRSGAPVLGPPPLRASR